MTLSLLSPRPLGEGVRQGRPRQHAVPRGLAAVVTGISGITAVSWKYGSPLSHTLQILAVVILAALATTVCGAGLLYLYRHRSRLAAELHHTSAHLHEEQQRALMLERSRKDLIAWVSGDLRRLLSNVQTLAGNSDSVMHPHLQIELERMETVVNDLLELNGLNFQEHNQIRRDQIQKENRCPN